MGFNSAFKGLNLSNKHNAAAWYFVIQCKSELLQVVAEVWFKLQFLEIQIWFRIS